MKLTKESRQRATAAMVKCDCGNVARLDSDQCGACENIDFNRNELQRQLDDCISVDDLKEFITTHLINQE